jgi:hypothetical protein
MSKTVKIFVASLLLVAGFGNEAAAQCAMCRATLENNVSNGDIGIAAGINFGILYLFVTPYLAIAVISFLWYRTSKRNAANKLNNGPVAG